MRTICVYAFLVLFTGVSWADDSCSVRWRFKVDRPLFAPLQAAAAEPTFGLAKSTSASSMKVDIGNGVDLVRATVTHDNGKTSVWSAGPDFFASARVTGWEGLRLQVDAVDGFFGGHLSSIHPVGGNEIQIRFRFLHLSGHYVDGHYDLETRTWKEGRDPVPFTRDFADICAAYGTDEVRVYAIIEHAFRIRPFNQRRTWYEAGGEWFLKDAAGEGLHPYMAVDLRLVGYGTYQINSNSTLGMKWGDAFGSGIAFFLRYYTGVGPYSEYLDRRISEWSVGFSVEYW